MDEGMATARSLAHPYVLLPTRPFVGYERYDLDAHDWQGMPMYLVAWDVTQAAMNRAISEGRMYSVNRGYTVRHEIASFARDLEDGLLTLDAMRYYVRRDVHDQHAWWLVPTIVLGETGDVGVDLSRYHRRERADRA